jgi:hypothetical protein
MARHHIFELNVLPSGTGAGEQQGIYEYDTKMVDFARQAPGTAFNGSYKLECSLDGLNWRDEGAVQTSDAQIVITKPWKFIRVNCTVAGAIRPKVLFSGYMREE